MIEPKSYLYKLLSLFLMLGFVFYSGSVLYAQRPEIRMPAGRIAISSDGNLHDSDDWGATAFSLAIISHAGLADRFVHYDYSNHLGQSRASWEVIMTEAAKGGARRFGLDASKVFDDQKQKAEAIANFVNEAKINTAQNPLWLICAGPMQMAWEMINATPTAKRQYIHCISHGKWNEIHVHGECQKTWEDLKKDFPTVTYHNIADQNKSNGENDFQSNISNWFWLRDGLNPNFKWLYNLDDTHFVDEQEAWKSNTKEVFDVSDAGMTYWLVTGGPNGGNDKGGWQEAKALFENPVKIKILECLEVDSVPADFPVSFSFLTSGERQFIAYYNKNRNLTMASRKIAEVFVNGEPAGLIPWKPDEVDVTPWIQDGRNEIVVKVVGSLRNTFGFFFPMGRKDLYGPTAWNNASVKIPLASEYFLIDYGLMEPFELVELK